MRGSFHTLPEPIQIACFGALFAMAEADGHVHRTEEDLIFHGVHGAALSGQAKSTILRFRRQPPRLSHCLSVLDHASLEIRAAILLQLAEVAWADGVLRNDERKAFERATRLLGVDEAVLMPLFTYARLKREGDQRAGLDIARGCLEELGVPLSALSYFELEGGHDEILDVLLKQMRARRRASRLRAMVDELCQPA